MPSWGKTDSLEDKPHWSVIRTMRPGLDTANGGGTSLTYATTTATFARDGSGIVAANANTLFLSSTAGIKVGMTVTEVIFPSNLAYNSGEAGFFVGNVTVLTVNSGNVVLRPAPGQGTALIGNVAVGETFVFGNAIVRNAATYESTYWADTILVTPTRLANATVNVSNTSAGWTHVRKKINNDGTVRYISEVLVSLTSPTASNTSSANTSNTQVFTGV
jgi:hypothetical protein